MFLLAFLSVFAGPMIVDGYTDRLSVFPGETVELYLNGEFESSNQTVRLFDINGRQVYSANMNVFPQDRKRNKPYEKGFDYKLTASLTVPDLPSGVYLWEHKVPLIIKARKPDILVLYPSNTANAYAASGGKSFYDYNSEERQKSTTLSFHRPIPVQGHAESFLQWIAKEKFSHVGYICDADMDNYEELKSASLVIVPGHSEYWTREARENFDRFVGAGKNAIVLSGNTMWWQVRYSDDKREIICYKSADDDKIKDPLLKTTRWNDPHLGYPITKSIGVDFSLAGYGLKPDKGWNGFKICSNSPLLEHTGLKPGDILSCPSDEYDGAPLSGFSSNGIPVINRLALGFEKIELVGFDLTTWSGNDGVATWIVFKATKRSGVVINTASTDWCSFRGIGTNPQIAQITRNMITKLLKKENVFSPTPSKETVPVLSN